MSDTGLPAAGHNNPPTSIDLMRSAYDHVAEVLRENPVIQSAEQAKSAKLALDRAKVAIDEAEAERKARVKPFNDQVDEINGAYKSAREPLARLVAHVRERLTAYVHAEEEARRRDAEEARARAAQAEAAARFAENAERTAQENAAAGEFTDVADATLKADEAFADYKAAERAAARAERDAKVKVAGGFGRALSARKVELFKVEDAVAAIREILKERDGTLPEKLDEALIAAAKDFRKAKGRLPKGVTSMTERRV